MVDEGVKKGRMPSASDILTLCAPALGQFATAQDVTLCALGPLGTDLIKQAEAATNSLRPPRKYVPWVTFNGKHVPDDAIASTDAFVGALCDACKCCNHM